MKLASLLVQYLLTYRRLDLPGIGSFLLDEPNDLGSEQHRHDKQGGMENVSFKSNTSIKQSPDLVQFIADQSGKIKALASADLESHLALAQQFLNIGNPYLFEGIGVLEKIRSGEYALIPGSGMQEKLKEFPSREKPDSPDPGESTGDYKKIFYAGKVKLKWQKPFVSILIVAGLGLAVWGGYIVYKKTISKNKSVAEVKKEEPVPVMDSVISQKDSIPAAVQGIAAGMQKFVLETAGPKRAFERYGKLKAFLWDVQMETTDSVTYKLFLVLPSLPADTSKIIDSLSLLSGRRVYLEH